MVKYISERGACYLYIHELITTNVLPEIYHHREHELASGLIVPVVIGRTRAVSPDLDRPSLTLPSGLVLPSAEETMQAQDSREDTPTPAERIDCSDLPAFEQVGIDRWRKLAMGSSMRLHIVAELVEVSRLENPTFNPVPIPVFERYVATPPEIEAISRIANAMNTAMAYPQPGTGQYL